MTDIHKMVLRLFSLWGLDDSQQSVLLGIVNVDKSAKASLLQIHAMLRLMYPNHPLRYEWVTRYNSRLDGSRPIDIMLTGASGIEQIRKSLEVQLLR